MANAPKIQYPDNTILRGELTFPIKSEKEIAELVQWRQDKGHKKPKFPDKIGATLFLRQMQYDKLVKALEDYMDFANTLYEETEGDKGVDNDVRKLLRDQIKKREWVGADGKPNLPIRSLSEKDIANLPDDHKYVGKVKFSGPWQEDIKIKAIQLDADLRNPVVVSIDSLIEDEILSEDMRDTEKLWWGSGWHFQVALRFNAYDSASIGISAYGGPIYLLPHLGLERRGRNTDAEVIAEGDDWSDED